MILNLYTFKGYSTTLVGPWITVGFFNNFKNLDISSIPTLLTNTNPFNFKDIPSNLEEYNYLLKDNFNMISIPAITINAKGSFSIQEAETKITGYFKALAIEKRKEIVVNKVTVAKKWDEKLTVLCAVFYRKEYLIRKSSNTVNYLELEEDINSHKDLICTYKYLPSNYILSNCISLCKNIEPKPRWFLKELIDLNNILKNENS